MQESLTPQPLSCVVHYVAHLCCDLLNVWQEGDAVQEKVEGVGGAAGEGDVGVPEMSERGGWGGGVNLGDELIGAVCRDSV